MVIPTLPIVSPSWQQTTRAALTAGLRERPWAEQAAWARESAAPPVPTENRAIPRPGTRGAAGQTRRSCRSSGAPVLRCQVPRNPDSISTSAELVDASPIRLAAVIRAIATSFGLIGHRSAAVPGGSANAQVTYWPVG